MNCPFETSRHPDLLVEFCAGSLEPVVAGGIRLHVDSCPRCAAFCRAQDAVWRALDGFEPAPVSPDFNRRLYRRIEAEGSTFWQRLRAGWGLFRPGAPAAIASVLALAILLLQSPHRAEFRQQAAETIDADNLEQAIDDLDMIRQLSVPPQADAGGSQPM